jgi:cathepsin L
LPKNELSLQDALANKGPISVAFYVTDNFKSYSSGIFSDSACPLGEINHAVTLVGYDTDSNGKQYYILRNQWGTNWGETKKIK